MVEASLVSGESLLVVGDVVSEGSGGRKTKVGDDNGDENGKEGEWEWMVLSGNDRGRREKMLHLKI